MQKNIITQANNQEEHQYSVSWKKAVNIYARALAQMCWLTSVFAGHFIYMHLFSSCLLKNNFNSEYTRWLIMEYNIFFHPNLSRDTAFPASLHVDLAKTEISLHIRAVWSVFTRHFVGSQGLEAYPVGQRRLWLACVDAQANMSLRWAHM